MITEHIEWENDTVRLVKLGGLERHANFPYNWKKTAAYRERPGRKIVGIVCHATQGSNADGLSAATKLARYCVANPKYKVDAAGDLVYRTTRSGKKLPVSIGGGRGWPGASYHILVPYRPEVQEGRFVVYRLWDDSWEIFHTGAPHNDDKIAIAWAGSFHTRWIQGFTDQDPHPTAFEAGTTLVLDYLLPRFGLTTAQLFGHFDFGKPTCPGDFLEQWVRQARGETIERESEEATVPLNMRELKSWRQRQEALIELGYDVGPDGADGLYGFWTRRAVEALQANAGLVIDGVWGPKTEGAVRRLLASH